MTDKTNDCDQQDESGRYTEIETLLASVRPVGAPSGLRSQVIQRVAGELEAKLESNRSVNPDSIDQRTADHRRVPNKMPAKRFSLKSFQTFANIAASVLIAVLLNLFVTMLGDNRIDRAIYGPNASEMAGQGSGMFQYALVDDPGAEPLSEPLFDSPYSYTNYFNLQKQIAINLEGAYDDRLFRKRNDSDRKEKETKRLSPDDASRLLRTDRHCVNCQRDYSRMV